MIKRYVNFGLQFTEFNATKGSAAEIEPHNRMRAGNQKAEKDLGSKCWEVPK